MKPKKFRPIIPLTKKKSEQPSRPKEILERLHESLIIKDSEAAKERELVQKQFHTDPESLINKFTKRVQKKEEAVSKTTAKEELLPNFKKYIFLSSRVHPGETNS